MDTKLALLHDIVYIYIISTQVDGAGIQQTALWEIGAWMTA